MPEVQERIGRLEVRMEQVEEGVANFKIFQKEAREFFTDFKANEKHRLKQDVRRSRVHFALLALLSGLVIALFAFMLTKLPHMHISFAPDQSYNSEQKAPQHTSLPYDISGR